MWGGFGRPTFWSDTMPRYKVLEKGFHGGVMYSPDKRGILTTDKELKPVPSWLEKIKSETAAQRKARLAAEKKAADADAEKAAQDKVEVDAVTFLESPKSTIETLG